MRLLIWGAGAMGGTIGAYLIRAGHDVTLGTEAGVPTPLTARLIELIRDLEEGRRTQSLETLDALNAVLSGG